MKKIAAIFTAILLTTIAPRFAAAQDLTADLVIINANIHTMDAKRPTARSIAVVGNKIVAVGYDADTKAMIGPQTRVIDAKGKLVLPGFNDAHVHFMETGSAAFVRRSANAKIA